MAPRADENFGKTTYAEKFMKRKLAAYAIGRASEQKCATDEDVQGIIGSSPVRIGRIGVIKGTGQDRKYVYLKSFLFVYHEKFITRDGSTGYQKKFVSLPVRCCLFYGEVGEEV